jgi:hypothetical protein
LFHLSYIFLLLYAILQNNFFPYLKNEVVNNTFKELKKEGYLNKIFEDFNTDNQEFNVKYYPYFSSYSGIFNLNRPYTNRDYIIKYFDEIFHVINQAYNVIWEKIYYYEIKDQIDNGYKLYSIIKNTSDFMILKLNKEVKILDIEILLYYKSNYWKDRYFRTKVFNGIILEFDLSVQKWSNLINSYYEQKKFFNSFFVLQGNKLYNFLSYDDLGINLREDDFYNFLDFLVINDSKIKELYLKYKEKIKRILDLFN